MPEVKVRLQQLALIEQAAQQAMDIADRCNEPMIGIRADECLQTVRERIAEISKQGRL
jgi:hypothetical protein